MEKAAFRIYLSVLIISPLLFGAVHTWVYTLVFLLIMAASCMLLWDAKGKRELSLFITGGELLFVLFTLLLITQMTPLPGWLLSKLSLEAKVAGLNGLPAAASLISPEVKNTWFTLAPYVHPARMSLIRWIVYGLLFFGLCRTLNSQRRVEIAVIVLLAIAVFDALYGITQTFSAVHNIWWWKNVFYVKDVTGTYVNRNHFAGFMEMGIVLAIVYAGAVTASERRPSAGERRMALKQKILTWFSGDSTTLRRVLIVFAGVVMGVGLALSASRGGILSAIFAILVMGLFFVFRRNYRKKGGIVLALFVVTLIYASIAGLDYTMERFSKLNLDHEGRERYVEKTLLLHTDYPLFGVGAGGFQYAFLRYQAPEDKSLYIDYAHSDWAQLMAETGYMGAAFLLVGLGWFLFRLLKAWFGRGDPFAVCLGIAPVGALSALGMHSMFDFNLHIPANFLILVAICAIGMSALHLEQHHRGDLMTWPIRSLPVRGIGGIVLVMLCGLILWAGIGTFRHFIAEAYCNTIHNSTMNLEQHQSLDNVKTAIMWDGGNAEYYGNLAREMMIERNKAVQAAQGDIANWNKSHEPIIEALEKAIRRNPLNAENHVDLGWEYTYLWTKPDYMAKWLPAADVCMERGAYYAGNWSINPRLHMNMGNYWVMRSTQTGPDVPPQDISWTKAVWHYGKILELTKRDKNIVEDITNFVKNFYADEEKIREAAGNAPK